ncbi:MAG: GNAT family N-acetyltransferase [Planctomycetaceae bacterium]|nr:GNAT family N-acetyltransferase [Planctomycetaceae bacterium]
MRMMVARTKEDWELAQDLVHEYVTAQTIWADSESIRSLISELPQAFGSPHGAFFLAFEEDRIAGCLGWRKLTDEMVEIQRVYVKPAFRGRGIGRRMLDSLIEDLRESGYRRIVLETTLSLRPAVALYESLGFQRIPPYKISEGLDPVSFALEFEDNSRRTGQQRSTVPGHAIPPNGKIV